MAIKIRLRKVGKKHQPYYRLIVADSREPRDGVFIDKLGFYDPIHGKLKLDVDSGKIAGWIKKGAVPTEVVRTLLRKYGFFKWYETYKKDEKVEVLQPKEIQLLGRPKSERVPKKKESEAAPEAAPQQ